MNKQNTAKLIEENGNEKKIKVKGGKVIRYKKAVKNKSYIGLNNQICKRPKYWCRLHEIYLSEEDAKKKSCKCKLTYDMLGTYKCNDLEDINE